MASLSYQNDLETRILDYDMDFMETCPEDETQ